MLSQEIAALRNAMLGRMWNVRGHFSFDKNRAVDAFISYMNTHLPNERDGFRLRVENGIPLEGMEAYIQSSTNDFAKREFLRRCVPENYELIVYSRDETDWLADRSQPRPLNQPSRQSHQDTRRRSRHTASRNVGVSGKNLYIIVRNSPRFGMGFLMSMVAQAAWDLRNEMSRVVNDGTYSPIILQVGRNDFQLLQAKFDNVSRNHPAVLIRDPKKNNKAIVAFCATESEARAYTSDLSLFAEYDG